MDITLLEPYPPGVRLVRLLRGTTFGLRYLRVQLMVDRCNCRDLISVLSLLGHFAIGAYSLPSLTASIYERSSLPELLAL